jgi:hypothetical protein
LNVILLSRIAPSDILLIIILRNLNLLIVNRQSVILLRAFNLLRILLQCGATFRKMPFC